MNEEALNHSYSLFKNDGYNGSIDDYKSLIKNNKDALSYSYELFKKDGYNGSVNEYTSLISVKKKDNTSQDSFEAPEQPLVLSKESGLGNKKSVPEKPTPLVDHSLVDKTPEDLSNLAYTGFPSFGKINDPRVDNDFNDLINKKNTSPKKDEPSFAGDLGTAFSAGFNKLVANIYRTPETIYDVAANAYNLMLDAQDYVMPDALKTGGGRLMSSDQISDATGVDNEFAKSLENASEVAKGTLNKYNGSITDNLIDGNYLEAAKTTAISISESMPFTLAIMLPSAAGVSASSLFAGTTSVMAADRKQGLLERDDLSETQKNANSLVYGAAEAFEVLLGGGAAGRVLRSTINKEGVQEAKKVGLNMVDDILRNSPYVQPLAEGFQEAITSYVQNLADITINGEEKNALEGVSDAFIVGSVMGGGFSTVNAAAKYITSNKKASDVQELSSDPKSRQVLEQMLNLKIDNGEMTPEQSKSILQEFENLSIANSEIPPSIQGEDRAKAIELQDKYNSIKKEKESVGQAFQSKYNDQLKEIEIELQNLLNNETKTEQPGGTVQQPTEQVPAKDTKTETKEAKETEVAVAEPKMVNAEEQTNDNYGTIERDGETVVLNKNEFRQAKRAFDEQQSDLTSIPSEEIESITQEELETKTEETNIETKKSDIERMSTQDLEKRQFEIEGSKLDIDEFNAIDKELEKREWQSVLNSPLDRIEEIIEKLILKNKEMPNGFGSYIDKRDAMETKSVAKKYSNSVSKAEAIKDFKDAFFGNPSGWYADGLKLRESTRVFIEQGGTLKELLTNVKNEFESDGFTEQDAAEVINNKLGKVKKANKLSNENNGAEVTQEESPSAEIASAEQKQEEIQEESLPTQPQVKETRKAKGAKGDFEYEVDIDENGNVIEVRGKEGRVINPTMKRKTKKRGLITVPNTNYQTIVSNATQELSDYQTRKEEKANFEAFKQEVVPREGLELDPYVAAQIAFADGARVNRESRVNEGNKDGSWASGNKKDSKTQSVKDLAHDLWMAHGGERYTDQDFRNAINDVISNYNNVNEIISDLSDQYLELGRTTDPRYDGMTEEELLATLSEEELKAYNTVDDLRNFDENELKEYYEEQYREQFEKLTDEQKEEIFGNNEGRKRSDQNDSVQKDTERIQGKEVKEASVKQPSNKETVSEPKFQKESEEKKTNPSNKTTAKNREDLVEIGMNIFGLSKKQAKANAIIVDILIGKSASRQGISKEEMYAKIDWVKGELPPLESLKQTNSNLKEFQDKILKENPELETFFISEDHKTIYLDLIEVKKESRKSGIGTKVLESLIKYADSLNKEIELLPAIQDDRKGTTSRSRLVKFYKRFGFVENKGRNKDFSRKGGSMYRTKTLYQSYQGAMLQKDGRYIIYALTNPNISTPLHEMAHVYENYLTEKEKQIVISSQNAYEVHQKKIRKNPLRGEDVWTTETSEFFARSFEKYLADGKAPNVALQKIFDDFKKWLKKIYKGIKGSEIDIELNQPMTQLFDRIFKDEGSIVSDREITSKVLFQMASKEGNLGLDIPNFIVKKGLARLKASYASGKSLEESIKDAINYFRKSKYSITQEKEVTFTDLVMAEIKGEKSDMREIGRIGETFSEQVQAVAEKNLEKRIELAEKARKKIEKHKQRIKERFRTKIKSDREAKSKFNELIKAIQKEAQIREIPTAVSNKLNRLLEGTLISNLDSKVDQAFLILQGVEYNQNLSKAKALIKQGKTKQKAARFSDSSGIIKNVLKINPKELTIPQLMEYISLLTDMRGKFLMKENEARLEKFQKIALDQLNNPKAKKELSEAQEKSLEERKNKQQEEKELRVKEVEFLQQQKQGELSEVAEKEYQFFQSITAEELNNLSLAEINSLIEGYQNLVDGFPINSSFVQASRKVKTARIVDTYLNATKSNKFKTLLRDRLNIFKRGLTKEKLERYLAEIPKNRIDDLVKGAKNKDLYESIIQPIEVGYSNHIAENDKIRKGFDKLFSKIPIRKREVEAIKLSLIAIEKEYQNNKPTQDEIGSSEVNPIADYIEASRLAASKDKSYESHYKKVKEVYESMLDSDGKFDYEIQEESLSKATKDVLVYAEQIGLQLADKIEVSAARNGDPITLRKYYTPLSVKVDKDINLKEILDRAEDFSMEPSLKTGRTKQRTPQGKALFFDFRENFLQASESISLDYHLREPLGTISAALNKLANSKDERFNENVSQEQVELAKAIAANLKQTTRDIFVNSYFDGKTWDRIKNLLKKRGYQMDLSSIPRAGVEFGSNTAFAMIYKPSELMQGLKHVKLFDKEGDIREFARLVETTQFTRLFDKSLSINQEVGSDLYTSSTMAGRLVDYVNDKTLSLPDRMIAQPLWIGSFYSEFKKATGVEFDAKKHNSDIEYRRENKEAIKKARDVADDNLAQSFATTNPYGGITNATITKDMSLFKAFTRYMTRFAKSEYQSLTDAINGAVGNNHLTKREGTALAFATIGRMGLYMWAMSMVGNMFYSGIAELGGWDDGEDEDEDLEKKAYRSVAGSIISLVLFRRLNNFQRIPLAIGVEYANAEFGDDLGLRESEALDPYKESLVYSTINSSYFTVDNGLLDGRPPDLTKSGNFLGSFAGPYNKLVKTLFRGADLSNRALYRKKRRTREAAKDELLTRTLPELFMETAGAPFSRDIKNMIIRNTFKEYRGKKKDGK